MWTKASAPSAPKYKSFWFCPKSNYSKFDQVYTKEY